MGDRRLGTDREWWKWGSYVFQRRPLTDTIHAVRSISNLSVEDVKLVPLIDHPTGNYQFLPGIAPYSCGVASCLGYEIAHVTLHCPVPYRFGFEVIREQLDREQRPLVALCAIELRSPRPFSFAGFAQFNSEYANILEEWGLFVNGANPVARTNVAPEFHPPVEPVLYGFSYTRPCDRVLARTCVVAGAGELPEGILAAEGIVAAGDTSPKGIDLKARFVIDLMANRLHQLGFDWREVTAIDIYTIHSIANVLSGEILPKDESASMHGVRWFYSRPPIVGIEYEMDLRAVRTELRIA